MFATYIPSRYKTRISIVFMIWCYCGFKMKRCISECYYIFVLYNGCVNSNTRKRYFFHCFSNGRWVVEIEENDKCDNQSNGKKLRVNIWRYNKYIYIYKKMHTNYPVIVCIMLGTSSEMKTLTNFQACDDIFMSNLFISTFSIS